MQSAIDFPWEWKHLTSDDFVHEGQGVLHTIVLNQVDDKQGMIGVFDGGDVVAVIGSQFAQPACLVFDLEYHNDLFIAFWGTWDITVTYK